MKSQLKQESISDVDLLFSITFDGTLFLKKKENNSNSQTKYFRMFFYRLF
jgi:hypothetical protein